MATFSHNYHFDLSKAMVFNLISWQSLSAELLHEGCCGTICNVNEPGSGAFDPGTVLCQYASGRTWAESAYMGISKINWMEMVVGDPLMAPFSAKPIVSFVSPTLAGKILDGTIAAFQVNAVVDGDPANNHIERVEFWLTGYDQSSGKTVLRKHLSTANASPYSCTWNLAALDGSGNPVYPKADYEIEAVAYQEGYVAGMTAIKCNVSPINLLNSIPDLSSIQLLNTPVIAGSGIDGAGTFYIEDSNRSCGIRIESSHTDITAGQIVSISGILHNNDSAHSERYIQASSVSVTGSQTVPKPLLTKNRSLGGSPIGSGILAISKGTTSPDTLKRWGPYNLGLFVGTEGTVTFAEDSNHIFYLDDGDTLYDGNNCNTDGTTGVRVLLPSNVTAPEKGDYVIAHGISSSTSINGNVVRLLRVRNSDDIIDYTTSNSGNQVQSINKSFATSTATSEELTSSDSTDNSLNSKGSIAWALTQPDGTTLDLIGVSSEYNSDSASILILKDQFNSSPDTNINLALPLNNPFQYLIPGAYNLDLFSAGFMLDVIGGQIETLQDGSRAIISPNLVQIYTTSTGQIAPPLPFNKYGESGSTGFSLLTWPWKLTIFSRQ